MPWIISGQCLLTGADLSYTNEITKSGGIYLNKDGAEIDAFAYFAERGTKIVRLRLWHTPSNNTDHCGNKINTNSLEDILEAARKVKMHGMQLKLSIHYSDYFVYPGKQKMPKAWEGLTKAILLDSIADYTLHVIEKLHAQNTLPDIISVGNETTWGFIDDTETTDGFDWNIEPDKYNAALGTIDMFNQLHNTSIKKAIHFTEESATWATGEFYKNGITNFDIIGISYYPFFSPETTLDKVGKIIKELHTEYEKEVMIFETGFAWSNSFTDNYNNFIGNNGTTVPYPQTPEGQKEFLLDLAKVVDENNGTALMYWEPAWITSDMCDKWGQGSSYENVSMYDSDHQPLPAFDFFSYCGSSTNSNLSNKNEIKIYPSPLISTELKIENAPSKTKWELHDLSGNFISKGMFENLEKINTLDLSGYSKGVYILSLFSIQNEELFIKKFIVP